MIPLTLRHRAKLYLAMQEALGVNDAPETVEDAQRLGLVEAASGFTTDDGDYALHHVYRLGEAMDFYMTFEVQAEGPHGFNLLNVAELVGGNRAVARAALKLLGARPATRLDAKDDWATDPDSPCVSVRFPPTLLVDFLRLELEEAEGFMGVHRNAA